MPNQPPSQMELNARLWLSLERKTAELMAAQHTPPPGALPLSREREIAAWWQRDEGRDEAALWQAAQAEHAAWIAQHPGVETDTEAMDANWTEHMTKVRDLVYPNRAKLLKAGGRAVSLKEQITYAERMAKHGPEEAGDGQSNNPGISSRISDDSSSRDPGESVAVVGSGALAQPPEEDPYGY